MGFYPIIQLSNYSKHPSVLPHCQILHHGSNSRHCIYLIIDFTFTSIYSKKRNEMLAAKLHFPQFLIEEGDEL